MFVVDTNILLYAAERSFPDHAKCRAALERWRKDAAAWFLTWPIVFEFLRVSTHPRVFATPWAAADAWRFVDALLASPGLQVLAATNRHATVARKTLSEYEDLRGNVMHDAHTAILMREHGVKAICTRDMDFHRFDFVIVIEPDAAI